MITKQETKTGTDIRNLIEEYVNAIRARDLDSIMSIYAPDLIGYDVVPPLQYTGAAAFRKPWDEVFHEFQGPIEYELRDLRIAAEDAIAFSYCLSHIRGTMANGRKTELWLRWTACFEKIDGKWRIVNTHVSVPADLVTGKAAMDIRP